MPLYEKRDSPDQYARSSSHSDAGSTSGQHTPPSAASIRTYDRYSLIISVSYQKVSVIFSQ